MASPVYNQALKTPKKIAIHYSVHVAGSKVGVKEIRDIHYTRDPKGCYGYHYVIKTDGTIQADCPENKKCWHTQNNNSDTIAICYIGGCVSVAALRKGIGSDTRTQAQKNSMLKLVAHLVDKYPSIKIIKSHTELHPPKGGCGGFKASIEYGKLLQDRSIAKKIASGGLSIQAAQQYCPTGPSHRGGGGGGGSSRSYRTGTKANSVSNNSGSSGSSGSSSSTPLPQAPKYEGPNTTQYSSMDIDNPYWAEIVMGGKVKTENGNVYVDGILQEEYVPDNDVVYDYDPMAASNEKVEEAFGADIKIPEQPKEVVEEKKKTVAQVMGEIFMPDGSITGSYASIEKTIDDAIGLVLDPLESKIDEMNNFINATDNFSEKSVDQMLVKTSPLLKDISEYIVTIRDKMFKPFEFLVNAMETVKTLAETGAAVTPGLDVNGFVNKCDGIIGKLNKKIESIDTFFSNRLGDVEKTFKKIQEIDNEITKATIVIKRQIYKYIVSIAEKIAYVIEWIKEKILAMFKWVYDIFVKLEDMIQTIIGETALGMLNALL